jgi:ubiquinone/menaquinone biosynthesis C-methylase UbiE
LNFDVIKFNFKAASLYLLGREIGTSDFQRSYNLLASSYDDEWYKYLDVVTTEILAEIDDQKLDYILDAGCGSGTTTLKLRKNYPDAHIVGLDFSKKMLIQARQKLGDNKALLFRDRLESGLKKFKDGQFDLIVCAWSLGYARNKEVYKELARILNQNGKLLIMTNKHDTLKAVQHSLKYTMCRHWNKLQKLPLHKFPKDKKSLLAKLQNDFQEVKYGEGSFSIDLSDKQNIVDWLLNSGILAGYEFVLDLRRDKMTRKTCEDYIKSNYKEVIHNYMWVLLHKK